MSIKETLQRVQENISLASYTTFKIGGRAKYLYVAKSVDDIIHAVTTAVKADEKFYLLGSGANTLVSDKGYDGLVILIKNDELTITGTVVNAGAGVSLGKLVLTTVREGLTGIECWAGIPGTVGGSVYGNMGQPRAEKGSISDWLTKVEVLQDGKRKVLTNQECHFSYRHSLFKTNKDIILSVTFVLQKSDNIASVKKSMKEYQKKKLSEQPLELPSSGCIFKNPQGQSAGKIIDELSLKGKKIGGAQISLKHGNFINNIGGATAEEVVMLISFIKKKVRDERNIQLEEEINYLGF